MRTLPIAILTLVIILVTAIAPTMAGEVAPPQVHDVAQTVLYAPGMPRCSDVSIRFFSVRPDVSLERMFDAGRAFHITRSDWSYITRPEMIQAIRERGWSFQGTTNAITSNPDHARRLKGEPVLDHFNKAGRFMADPNIPAYRDWYVQQVAAWIDQGVVNFQRDEPSGLGGRGRAWEPEESDAFYREVHARIAAHAKDRRITWSCNLVWNHGRFGKPEEKAHAYTRHFDYGMTEFNAPHVTAAHFWLMATEAQANGKALVLTGGHELPLATLRRAIAAAYANGLLVIVPWDQFGGITKPRIFSEPKDLADLYGFVRGIAPLLEGHFEAAAIGSGIKDQRWSLPPLAFTGRGEHLSASIRAQPSKAQEAVVVHLIDWADKTEAFGLRFDRRAIGGTGSLTAELLTPAPYDATRHAAAAAAADALRKPGEPCGPAQAAAYAPLVQRQVLTLGAEGDHHLTVQIPRLTPWGVLVLTPQPVKAP